MATKTKKAAKAAKANKGSNGKAKAHKGTVTAQDMRDAYDKNPKSFNIAEYAAKHDVAYGRVYGAIMKHTDGQPGKVVKKAAAKKEKAVA